MYVLTHICLNTSRHGNLAQSTFLRAVVGQLEKAPKFGEMIARGSRWLEDGEREYPIDVRRFDSFFDALTCAIYLDKFDARFDSDRHTMRHVYLNFRSEDDASMAMARLAESSMSWFATNHADHIEHYEADRVDEVVYENDVIAPAGTKASITIGHRFYGSFRVISLLTQTLPPSLRSYGD
ncbi:MAG: hypothetical protein JNL04_07640 [Rhodospirillaceae bacterium]|nr:hypothetical protein [Rhodospirillaceae bacterium]